MKYLTTLTIALSIFFFYTRTNAAISDTTIFYLKNSSKQPVQKDSADYVRFILSPDTSVDRDLFKVYDYSLDGKPIMAATSLTKTLNLVLDGRCFFYFPNGKVRSTIDFSKGVPKGYITQYYPNGRIYTIIKINISFPYYSSYNYSMYYNFFSGPNLFPQDDIDLQIVECCDSTGNITATKGNGYFTQYSSDFKRIIAQGKIVNSKQEGDWTGPIADSGKFVIIYHKGDIKSGISYMKSGREYKFKQTVTRPDFSDGLQDFFIFIKKNAVYLESARKRKISGTVNVKFYIEPDGTLSDFQVVQPGLTESLNQEALRVVRMSPLWIPGTVYGVPTRMFVIEPVSFYPY